MSNLCPGSFAVPAVFTAILIVRLRVGRIQRTQLRMSFTVYVAKKINSVAKSTPNGTANNEACQVQALGVLPNVIIWSKRSTTTIALF